MDKIWIENRKGQKLSAIFHRPEEDTEKIIILTHSFKGHKSYQPIFTEFPKHICDEGYAVIRFDCWGSGESEGEFQDSSITTQVEDLEDVIEYARSEGYSDICLAGLSLGTSVSIMAYDESIKCLLLWSPVFHQMGLYERYKDEVLKKGYIIRTQKLTNKKIRCGKKMWQDFKDVKPYERLPEIKCPVLAIIGSEDEHIQEAEARKFVERIPSKSRLGVVKTDHDFLNEDGMNKVIELSTDFIKENL